MTIQEKIDQIINKIVSDSTSVKHEIIREENKTKVMLYFDKSKTLSLSGALGTTFCCVAEFTNGFVATFLIYDSDIKSMFNYEIDK